MSLWFSKQSGNPLYAELKSKDYRFRLLAAHIGWLIIALFIVYETYLLYEPAHRTISLWLEEVIIGFIIGMYIITIAYKLMNLRLFYNYKQNINLIPKKIESHDIWMPFQRTAYGYETTFLVIFIIFLLIPIPFLLGWALSPLVLSYYERKAMNYYRSLAEKDSE